MKKKGSQREQSQIGKQEQFTQSRVYEPQREACEKDNELNRIELFIKVFKRTLSKT